MSQILNSFGYPLRGKNIWAFVFTVAFVWGVELMAHLPRPLGTIYGFLGAGYLASFYMSVVGSTITGADEIPNWPEWTSLARSFATFYSPFLISFLPIILYALLADDPHRGVAIFLSVCGLMYLPMGIGSVSAEDSIIASLPHIVLPLIINDFPKYLLSFGALFLGVLALFVSAYLAKVENSVLLWFILYIPNTYLMLVSLRIIGLTYMNNSKDW